MGALGDRTYKIVFGTVSLDVHRYSIRPLVCLNRQDGAPKIADGSSSPLFILSPKPRAKIIVSFKRSVTFAV